MIPDCITATCFFCDDIRQEASGKKIYLGVYNQEIITAEFPYVYDKIYVVTKLRAPINHPRPSHISVRLEVPGGPDLSYPVENLSPQVTSADPEKSRAWEITLTTRSHLELTTSGFLRVNIDSDLGSIQAGGLYVTSIKAASVPDFEGTMRAAVNFTQRYQPTSSSDRRKLADSLYEVIEGLLLDRVPRDKPIPEDLLVFAQRTAHDFFILYGRPRPKTKIKILHNDRPIKFKITRRSPFFARVELLDREGPNYFDGLVVHVDDVASQSRDVAGRA